MNNRYEVERDTSVPTFGRTTAAQEAGLSERQRKTALLLVQVDLVPPQVSGAMKGRAASGPNYTRTATTGILLMACPVRRRGRGRA